MEYGIGVTLGFEAAHRLHLYRGKCQQIHGHSYKIRVEIQSSKLTPSKKTPPSMVMDFSVLKRIIKENIIEYFDHKLILAHRDPLVEYLMNFNEHLKVMVLPEKFYDPTAECLAQYFCELLKATRIESDYGILIKEVIIYETENSYASFKPYSFV